MPERGDAAKAVREVTAAIGLGSNLGDRLAMLSEALRRIAALPRTRIVAKSSVYETEPVGVPARYREMTYLNAVAIAETSLPVEEWSRSLHAIEDAMHRVRTGERNSPRTIDIDLLTYGDMAVSLPGITLPHPQCTNRRFVCAPLAEAQPGFTIPGTGKTAEEALAALPERPAARRLGAEW